MAHVFCVVLKFSEPVAIRYSVLNHLNHMPLLLRPREYYQQHTSPRLCTLAKDQLRLSIRIRNSLEPKFSGPTTAVAVKEFHIKVEQDVSEGDFECIACEKATGTKEERELNAYTKWL